MVRRKIRVNFVKWVPLLFAGLVLWFIRPWLHSTAMIIYKNPFIIEIIVIGFVLQKLFFRKRGNIEIVTMDGVKKFNLYEGFFFVIVPLFILGGFTVSSILTPVHIVNEFDYNSIDALPETKDNIRLMPYDVAYRYSKDSLQLSQFKLGTENIALIDGSLSWMFPLIPDGAILEFTLKNKGIVYIDATTQEKNTNMVWKDLSVGEGMQIFDNLEWKIFKEMYLVDLDDPYYIPYNDEIYTVISAVSYTYHSKFGFLYSVPRFAGVFLMDSNGDITFLTPEQAKENEVLKGNRVFPENLARFYTESYVYNKGIINRFFIHEDQIDIQDVMRLGRQNRQPFLMDTSDGLKWFISTEPHGESHGIFKIFLIDAIDGNIDMHELPVDKTLTGPVKATDFVRRENPIVDWTRFQIVEPLPFITGSILYWKVVVIPGDAAGIAYQAFVDSETNEVFEAKTDEEIMQFVRTGVVEKDAPAKEKTRDEKITEIKEKLKEVQELVAGLE